jgi:hypothetical protein
MAQFKIENKKLSIDIFGVVYQVRKPKFKEVLEMEEKMEALNSKGKFLFIMESLTEYGIPKEILEELDSSAVIEILEIVNGSKKN